MNLEEFQFLEDQVFPYTEDTKLEFKMVNPTAPDRKKNQERIKKRIWNYFKEYAIAFLNATVTGNLLIGILDEKNIPHLAKGIFLEPDFKDEIDRTANEQLKEIVRAVPLSCFKIDFHSLYNADKQKKDDWYIIQFSVTPVKEQDFLYRTKSGNCWIRRGSANVQLSENDGSYNEELNHYALQVHRFLKG